jgi:protein-L-isoaspartate(D-aspartate) O-methyltransferase
MSKPLSELQFDLRWKLADAGIDDRRVLDAVEGIPRSDFVGLLFAPQAWDIDFEIPIGDGQRMNRIFWDALIAQELRLSGVETVLEIGTGAGYLTVLLADLCEHVTTVERILRLVDLAFSRSKGRKNIKYIHGDGTLGCPERAPFDRIVVSAAALSVPKPLLEQLKPGGRMVIPIGPETGQVLREVEKTAEGSVVVHDICLCRFSNLSVNE